MSNECMGLTGDMNAAASGTAGGTGGMLKAIETDALIEPSFRRLLASIEAERERIRAAWQQVQQDRDATAAELEALRQDTEDWCYNEQTKIDAEWKRLDRLSERMNDVWPESTEVIDINCSGTHYSLPRRMLTAIEGSVLAQMFSDPFIGEIPRDEVGRYYLDFNPQCFAILVEYLQNRRLKVDAPLPIIPVAQQRNMELLAEAWCLKPFLRANALNPVHGTSLIIKDGNTIESSFIGWQMISAQYPLPMASPSYFEVKVLANPDTRGGLAFGVCGHIPAGAEIHTIRIHDAILYISNNGLVSECVQGLEDVQKGIQLEAGSTLGVRHDTAGHSFQWYHNRAWIGTTPLKAEWVDKMQTIYPVFALYVPGQTLQVNFGAGTPPPPGAILGAVGSGGAGAPAPPPPPP